MRRHTWKRTTRPASLQEERTNEMNPIRWKAGVEDSISTLPPVPTAISKTAITTTGASGSRPIDTIRASVKAGVKACAGNDAAPAPWSANRRRPSAELSCALLAAAARVSP